MNTVTRPTFQVAGLTVRTTNKDNRAAQDIGGLWQQFFKTDLRQQLGTARQGETIYVLYTNYESDYKGFYDVVVGYEVNALNSSLEGVQLYTIPQGHYRELDASGKTIETIPAAWNEIWQQDWPRTYEVDYEQYQFDDQKPMHADAKIYIGVKE